MTMSGDEIRSGDETTNGVATADEAPPADTHDAETLRRIVALNRSVTAARDRFDAADRARKVAKEELEDEQAILNRFIAGLDEDLPLFDRGDGVGEPADATWRDTPVAKLAEFGLADGLIGKLEEANQFTIGALASWTASKPLTDIPGIGASKAEKIADALEAFWRDRGNAEVLAGVREAEAGKGDSVAQGVSGWRDVVIGDLGLSEATVAILDAHTISTVGELVAIARHGLGWMGDKAAIDVEDALSRFRNRRSNADIEEFDAARDDDTPPVPPRVRGRRAAGTPA